MKKRSVLGVILVTALCCLMMALVDGVLRPGYGVKSAIKLAVFMLVPLGASRLDRSIAYLSLLRPRKKGVLTAIALGAGI